MTIRSKLLLNALITVVCMISVGITGYFFANRLEKVSSSLLKAQVMPIIKMNEAKNTAKDIFLQLVIHNAASDIGAMKNIEKKINELNSQMAEHIKEHKDSVDLAQFSFAWTEEFQKEWNQFMLIAKGITDMSTDFSKEDAFARIMGKGKDSCDRVISFLDEGIKEHHRLMTALQDEAMTARRNALIMIVSLTLLALCIALGGALFVNRSIGKPVSRISRGLSNGAVQVNVASSHILSASQSLSEGSSEQAASSEEAVSALEEMATMSRKNANNADYADKLMKEIRQIVAEARNFMNELSTFMEDISKASEETSKIVKAIDEIAFQTNLLALNAAVEAARAGEAGAGFAVVADEVRNLAMRTADAAKNTAGLIENTIRKMKDGTEFVSKTNEAFVKVAGSIVKAGELVSEIAAASKEQAQGVDQINAAYVEMDEVDQRNAANAEELSGTSQEMNTQARHLNQFVDELAALVGSKAVEISSSQQESVRGNEHFQRETYNAPGQSETVITGAVSDAPRQAEKDNDVIRGNNIRPEQIIPLDEEDFEDF